MKGKTTCNEDKKEGMLYKLILVVIPTWFCTAKKKILHDKISAG